MYLVLLVNEKESVKVLKKLKHFSKTISIPQGKILFLGDEDSLRSDKGFSVSVKWIDKVKLFVDVPDSTRKDNVVEFYFLFNEEMEQIPVLSDDVGRFVLINPDEVNYLFRMEVKLSDKKTIVETKLFYKKLSFEFDDEKNVFYLVAALDFEPAWKDLEKKVTGKVEIPSV